jgi:hypothetical protein
MSTPDPVPSVPVLPQRALRVAALALLSLFVTPFLVIFALGSYTAILVRVIDRYSEFGTNELVTLYLFIASWLLIAVGVFVVFWKLLTQSWTRIIVSYAVVALVLACLAHDEPTFRHPMTMEDISPVFSGEEASYNLLMRYGKQHPLGQSFQAPSFKHYYSSFDPSKTREWRETITSRREEFEAHWTQLSKEREWWNELGEFDKIGDLMPANWDGEIPSFSIFRTLSQHGVAIACLQAMDGHGDQAIDTLLPILKVGRKLQPYSRTLVRTMIGIVIEKLSINAANFILNTTPVSPEARARLAEALKGGDPEAGARHMMFTEYTIHFGWMSQARMSEFGPFMSSGGARNPLWTTVLNTFSPVFYLPRSTFNRVGDLYVDWADLVAKRKLDQLDPRWQQFSREMAGPSLKNPIGRQVALMSIPAFQKVAENYWKDQDMRAALLERLAKP